jgi:hypothetical protein
MKPKGYFVFRSPTNNVWSGQRGLDEDVEKARALVAKLRIYPYSQRNDPPVTRHLSPGGKKWSAQQPRGIKYWEGLARTINSEPALERDRMILAMLVPLAIEKGKPFNPDERQKSLLVDAANVGEIMARTNGYAKRFPDSIVGRERSGSTRFF